MNKINNTFFFGMILFLGISMYLGYENERLEQDIEKVQDCGWVD